MDPKLGEVGASFPRKNKSLDKDKYRVIFESGAVIFIYSHKDLVKQYKKAKPFNDMISEKDYVLDTTVVTAVIAE